MDVNNLTLRQLQQESSRALATMQATNNNIYPFNKQVIAIVIIGTSLLSRWYVDKYGGLPSQTGPGKDIIMVYDGV